jgi:hypothetical protein
MDALTLKSIDFTPVSLRDTEYPRAESILSRDRNFRTLEEFNVPPEQPHVVTLQERTPPCNTSINERLTMSAPASLTLEEIQELDLPLESKATMVQYFMQKNSDLYVTPESQRIAKGIYSPNTGVDISQSSPHNSKIMSDDNY